METAPFYADTLIVSDIHAGWRFSRFKNCIELIHRFHGRRLLLNGDILHHRNRIDSDGLELTRAMLDALQRGIETILVLGNHDPPAEFMAALLPGVRICHEWGWESGPKRCFAQHGHQFNHHNGLVWRIGDFLKEIPDNIHHFIQRIEGRRHRLSRLLRWMVEKAMGINSAMFRGAHEQIIERRLKVDAFFCGHSHWPEERRISNVSFFNSGCWVGCDERMLSYITIDDQGTAEIVRYIP